MCCSLLLCVRYAALHCLCCAALYRAALFCTVCAMRHRGGGVVCGGGLRGGGVTLLLGNCSLKGFGTGKKFWPILLVGCGWLLIPGALWVVAIIHPQVAPETVNLKNFPGPQLRLPPALEEGEGWGGVGPGRETSSFHFFCSNACLGGSHDGWLVIVDYNRRPVPWLLCDLLVSCQEPGGVWGGGGWHKASVSDRGGGGGWDVGVQLRGAGIRMFRPRTEECPSPHPRPSHDGGSPGPQTAPQD